MIKSIAIIILCCSFTFLHAQNHLSGTIKDNKGNALPGVSITLEGTYDGTVSDIQGNWKFDTEELGNQLLLVTSIGYDSLVLPILINSDTNINLNIILKESLNQLKAVVITAGAFEASDSRKAGVVLNSLDIVTVAGGNGDINGALKTLPGAQQVGEQEGLFVRGGEGYETAQFIDGTLVSNPFYSSVKGIAARGRFSPFIFKGTVFSTGGFSALYGGALSSALILESIDFPERSTVGLSISPIFVGANTQQVNNKKDISYGFGYTYVNIFLYNKLIKQRQEYFQNPVIHEGDANLRWKINEKGIIKYYTNFSNSNFGLRRPDIDSLNTKESIGIKNNYTYHNLSLRQFIGNNLKLDAGIGYNFNKDQIAHHLVDENNEIIYASNSYFRNKNFQLTNVENNAQAKVVLQSSLSGLNAIRGGFEYRFSKTTRDYNKNISDLEDHYSAIFAETDIYLNNDLAAKIGIRGEYSAIMKKYNLAPRISLAYKLNSAAQVSAAYGLYFQKPEADILFIQPRLDFMQAQHFIINFLRTKNSRIFRIEGFYKQYNKLIRFIPISQGLNAYNNSGKGNASGIELFWRDRKSIKNFDYWLSYSWLHTTRIYNGFSEQIQPDFATDHTVSLVLKKFFMKIKTGFNATYSFATGRPYYYLKPEFDAARYVIADRGTTKPFHNMGFSVNYVPSAGKPNAKMYWVLVFSINNLLGYTPEYGYQYAYDGSRKTLVTATEKRGFFIGAFFSWGVDRTDEAINNNL